MSALKRFAMLLSIAAVIPMFSSCAVSKATGLQGLIFTDVTGAALVTAQANMKSGEACASSILGLIATGNASMGAAARNGGISSVGAVDVKDTTILGLYSTHCTIVHGR